MSYLGRSAKLSLKAQEKVSFLATAGQTSKTGLSYTPSFVEVYVNGVLLTDTTDFTATNGNSITFTVALLLNDEVTVISLKTFSVADHYSKTEADTLLAAKATNTAVALKAPIASPVFTGNVGVGVTPETSGSNYNVLQIGQGGSLMAPTATEDMYVGSNVYRNSSNTNSYIVTEKASIYEQYNGEHYFNVAPSGSADAAISFAQGMKISNAGIVTKPLQPAFSVSKDNGNVAIGADYIPNYVRHNIGSHYSTSNGRFTAPIAGSYHFSFEVMNHDATYDNKSWTIRKNGSAYQAVYGSSGGSVHHRFNWSGTIYLGLNDYIDMYTGNLSLYGGGLLYSHVSGHLIG